MVLWAQSATRITSGLKTNFTLSPSYSFQSHSTTIHVFWAYLYSAGTQHGNLHPAGWPILFCGPTQKPCVSRSQHRKNRERFWKNAGEWTGRVEISEEEIPGSKRSMYGYILTTPGFTGRTFKLCVLTRWDFNFCVRSSPLREEPTEEFNPQVMVYKMDCSWIV